MYHLENFVHPYIPNSAPAAERAMLQELGVERASDLYDLIPEDLKLSRRLDIPGPFLSEPELKRHMNEMLRDNISCEENLNFLGAGCWQHSVPALCDEIMGRAEFLTAYCGDTYSDKGKYQAIFEYQSMLGELVGMDLVSCPTYDWSCALGSALLMAGRITGRKKALLVGSLAPERLAQAKNFCKHAMELALIPFSTESGTMEMDALRGMLGGDVACVYFENPNFLGVVEPESAAICAAARAAGAISIVGVDAISLGVYGAPADYGADIVVGDSQCLGSHMQSGGNVIGFIATRDEDVYCAEYPTRLYSIAPGVCGETFGFGQCTHERTSYVMREHSPDFIGTSKWLSAIGAGVYLALMGPDGMREVGETILKRRAYAERKLAEIPGVCAPRLTGSRFKEFVVNFDKTGKSVAQINEALLEKGIFGGYDLSGIYPELGQSALYCVTELHSKADIDRLAEALKEAVK
nr:aminomethyl-transferring glycine dehydrogenase subunit GcvPA [uncultured Oscillibacter sp.]